MVLSRNTCTPTGRVMYHSAAEAAQAAEVNHGPMKVYCCKLCRTYHLSPNRKKKKREKPDVHLPHRT